jgi:glutamate synthase domain-containing protein 2
MAEGGSHFLLRVLEWSAALFVLVLGLLVAAVVVIYVIDRTQTRQAIRRNYPVIGRFRYLFEHLGEFFRQYFFAMDREELPFNRSERSWAYRAAKDVSNTVAFGSTRDLRIPGTVIFVNHPYPPLEQDQAEAAPLEIGPGAAHPYLARSLFNISAMSYGAISRPAVRALSAGAARAGCWLNTGEGGLAPYHLEGGADVVFQIGTAKNGVGDGADGYSAERLRRIADTAEVKMVELKLSQGAKPGKGGILPGGKVTAEIAEIRGIPVGRDAISPNRHPDIDSVDALLDVLCRLRDATGRPVGFKAVMGDPSW